MASAALVSSCSWQPSLTYMGSEVNNGGEMVGHVIRTIDPTVAYKALHASHGKVARAEPVAALYEQGKAHHVGYFPDLEDQQCNWVPGDKSPDRLDACVWALTELLLGRKNQQVAIAISSTPEEREQRRLQEQLATRRALEQQMAAAQASVAATTATTAAPGDPEAAQALAVLEAALRVAERDAQEQAEREQEQRERVSGILGELRRIRGY